MTAAARPWRAGLDAPAFAAPEFTGPADSGGRHRPWAAQARSAPTAPAGGRTPAPTTPTPAAPAPRDVLDERAQTGYARGVGAFCLYWYLSIGVIVIPLLHRYRHPAVPVAVWVVMGAVTVAAVRRQVRRPLTRPESALLVLAAIGAEILVARECRGYNVVGYANWPSLSCSGLLPLVVASRPTREWVAGAAAFSAVLVVEGLTVVGARPLAVSRLASAFFGIWAVLILVALTHRALRSTSRANADAAEAELALAAAESAQAAIRDDRSLRLDVLEARTLPLVRALAEGRLDPLDARVRVRCGSEAASLRRILAGTTAPTAVLAGLPAAVDAAEQRGVRIEFQVVGDLAGVPKAVRAGLVRPVIATLDDLAGGSVLVTVLGGRGHASVVAAFPLTGDAPWPPPGRAEFTPAAAGPGADPGAQIEIRTDIADGRAVLLVRWPRGDDG